MRQPSNIILALVLLSVINTLAQAAPATQPTTQAVATEIIILPFTALGNDHSLDWAGRAVQQNLLTDLAHNKFPTKAANQAPLQPSDAKFIVAGTYQLVDEMVRFNGRLTDARTGKIIGGLSATGAIRDLYSLEDSLSSQLLQQLARQPTASPDKPPAPVPAALQPAALAQAIQPPAVAQVRSTSSYEGSSLQQYVNSNRTPSTDFDQQSSNAQYRNTFGSYNNYYSYGYGGLYSPFYFGTGLTCTYGYSGFRNGYAGGFYSGHRQHIVNADR